MKRNTKRDFQVALRQHDQAQAGKHWGSETPARRAMFAAFWFIENVADDDPHKTELFFEVRKLVRAAAD